MMKTAHKKLTAALAIILAAVAIISIYRHNKYAFTVEKWHSLNFNERQYLAEDFIRQYGEKDLSKDEITDMLGQDNYTDGYYNPQKTDDNLAYNFGAKNGINSFYPGNVILVVEFDENDIAISYNIVYHSW
jgi:hypothetical protein